MSKLLKNIPTVVGAALLTWLVVSYFEIVIYNTIDPTYSKYNLVVLLFKTCNELLTGGIF